MDVAILTRSPEMAPNHQVKRADLLLLVVNGKDGDPKIAHVSGAPQIQSSPALPGRG